jgi:hypothetical protein
VSSDNSIPLYAINFTIIGSVQAGVCGVGTVSVCDIYRIMSLEEMTEIAFVALHSYSHMMCIVVCYQYIL